MHDGTTRGIKIAGYYTTVSQICATGKKNKSEIFVHDYSFKVVRGG